MQLGCSINGIVYDKRTHHCCCHGRLPLFGTCMVVCLSWPPTQMWVTVIDVVSDMRPFHQYFTACCVQVALL